MKKNTLLLLIFVLVLFSSVANAAKMKILLIGDTQKVSDLAPADYSVMTQWIVDNAASQEIAFVLHMGDLTENSNATNWPVAQSAMFKMDNVVNYVMTVGNNDLINDANANNFNQYFPLSHYNTNPAFVSNYDRFTNNAWKFDNADVKWLVVSLRNAPTNEALTWAENLITANPDRKVIILSHDISTSGVLSTQGTIIWNRMKKFSNILFMFCGHVNSNRLELTGDNGNKVYVVCTDYQTGGAGESTYMGIAELDTFIGTADFWSYSPKYRTRKDMPGATFYSASSAWSWIGLKFIDNLITYPLTVNGGMGSSSFPAGAVVPIIANTAPSGQVFDKWIVNSGAAVVENIYNPKTNITISATATTVTASYIPVPANYLYLDDCDALNGWNSSVSLTLNTADKKQGTSCLEFNGSGTDEFKKLFNPAYNSNATVANAVLKFWYYVSNASLLGTSNQVELGSGGAPDLFEFNWSLKGLVTGWNYIVLNTNKAGISGGTPNLNAINWFRMYNIKSGSIISKIDALEIEGGATIPSAVSEISTTSKPLLYPNPVKDRVYISGLDKIIEITIRNITGNIVKKIQTSGSIDVSNLEPGIYFLIDGTKIPVRFIKS
jgi:predicted phosphodiesterase